MAAETSQAASQSAKKPLYEGSTQYKNWRFSPEKLTQIRASLNAAAVTVIRNTFEADEVCHAQKFAGVSLDNHLVSQGHHRTSSF
jgi:cyclin H